MEYQRTLGEKIALEGEGIFTGKRVKVEIEPAEADVGIWFVREDLENKPCIPLRIENVIGLEGATAVTDGKHFIYLVEHLLSALHGLQIDNAIVRVYGEEIPLLDGSAYPWVRKIQEVGYRFLVVPRKKFRIKRYFQYQNGVGSIIFKPADKLKITAFIKFDHPLIGEQSFHIVLNPRAYITEISFARTFGFKDLLVERFNRGILKGGNFSNAIVLDEKRVLNEEGLRTPDEFVRHKVLDVIGDLYTLGRCVIGEIEVKFSGHKLHIKGLKTLYSSGYMEEVECRALTFFLLSKRKRTGFSSF